jgi:hypothetical protein
VTAPGRLLDTATLAVLVVDGFLVAVVAALFLPAYLGAVAFPISAVLAALANVALIYAARSVRDSLAVAALPLAGFGAGFLAGVTEGPGGDIVLGASWQTLLLLVLGAGIPAVVLYRT